MNCVIHFYLLNAHFSIEHAEEHHDGEESEFNRRHEWEDELKITTEVEGVEVHGYSTFHLQGKLGDKQFSYDVENMRIFEIKGEVSVTIGCSESILDSYVVSKTDNAFTVEVFLKDFEPMTNPIPGVYIASQEFPKDLVF